MAASASTSPRVLIADKHVAIRDSVRVALEESGFVVCSEADTAREAVSAALRDHPDVCVVDVDIPGGGIGAAAAIRGQLAETHVVMLSTSDRDDDLFDALEAGASGYLVKKRLDPARLGPTLVGVLHGEAALPRVLAGRLIREFRARARRGEAGLTRRGKNDLTPRQWEVLDCLCEGMSTKRIADELFLSQTTVRRHISSIRAKLKAPTRQAVVDLVAKRSRNLNAR